MVSQNQLLGTGPLASVLAKIGVAITGGGLILFVLAHMFGNLQVFLGPDTFNLYAYKMQNMVLLWPARIGLLAIFVIHMGLVFLLTRQNSVARPVGYASYEPIQSTVASRYMLQTGIVILLFVVYHLLHFTLHRVHYPDSAEGFAAQIEYQTPPYVGQQMHNAYGMVLYSFQQPVVALIYVLAQLFLAAHLWHGGQSLFQTIGVKNENRRALLTRAGPVLAIVVLIGNCSIPIAVLLNILPASPTA